MDIGRNQDFGLPVSCLRAPHSSAASSAGFLGELHLPQPVYHGTLSSPHAGLVRLTRPVTHTRFTWLSMRSSTSDVLPSSASTIARIPDPEMKFDSTFRLFSVLLTFSISARACGQRWAERDGSQAGAEHRGAAGLQLPSPPEDSRRIPHETSAKQFSLPPDGSAVCGVKGFPVVAGGFLNMSMLEATAKPRMDKHLG